MRMADKNRKPFEENREEKLLINLSKILENKKPLKVPDFTGFFKGL